MTRREMLTAMTVAALVSAEWLASASPALGQQTQPKPVQISRSQTHTIVSQAVGDEFVIQVRLPESYDKGQANHPVVYVLDSDVWFGVASDIADNLPCGKEMPEVVVVGISYGSIADWEKKRSRDLTPTLDRSKPTGESPLSGGAARFLEFIAAELMPFIDSHYRTEKNDRALVGYSYGGLLGAYTLFTRPELFQRYILIAPSLHWDERCLWKTEAAYGAAHTALRAIVFTAIGDRDSQKKIVEPWHDFNRLIEGRHYEGLRWFSQVFSEETHLSIYPAALTRGLRAVYAPATPGKTEEKK